MKKKIYATLLTAGVATALIAGNGAISAFAFSVDSAPNVNVTSQQKVAVPQPVDPNAQPSVVEGFIPNPDYKEPVKTSQDMSEDEAVALAKKALQNKFNDSLTGLDQSTYFVNLVDQEGTFYSVFFTTPIDGKTKQQLQEEGDVYIANVNSKTGEVVSADKNPVAKMPIGG
ncbi:hypothetical protein [Paenibacillus oryzisoli]|uniref:PepSY domain-containing protein n=1 Tax=Paenibacillus oryzisoli TaxID=1850517 RepID=A0A198AB01_9BACL|nr:hypothetical protein [Paenibacillus oryzisoli]OAS18674.1 hypothetical protein A8708_29085 [Paenibacillus oryzisoli]